MGKITKWSDPAIAGQNPDVKLPDMDIVVVHRSDGSGTTYIFTDYLSKVSGAWKASVGKGTSVSWPSGIGGKGNEGVSGQVKQVSGSIGYIELAYAKQNHLSYADVKNSSGVYVAPSIESVTEALATASIPDDFRFSMVNPPGEKAYPISGTTWLLIYAEQKDHAKGEKLVQFLKWAYSEGEKFAPALDYAPLPESLVKRTLERVNNIKY
jgi:phosphate transport system substrate-binding protein